MNYIFLWLCQIFTTSSYQFSQGCIKTCFFYLCSNECLIDLTMDFIIRQNRYVHSYWFINPKLKLNLLIWFGDLYCILNTSLQMKLQYGLHWVVYHHPLCTQKKIYIGSYNTACSTCAASKVLNPLDWRLNKSSFP